MSLEEGIKDTRQLLSIHKRHLQKAKEQQAAYGLASPPHLLVEIEDRETIIEKLTQQLVDLESRLELGEEPEIVVRQPVSQQTTRLTDKNGRITLKKMLMDLIQNYFTETNNIEVRFNSLQKSYNIILSKEASERQQESTE